MGKRFIRPTTATELYLDAIHSELVAIRKALEGAGQPQVVELREPETDQILPAGFPGIAALQKAGIYTRSSVPREYEALKQISGIGSSTARAILKELSE